MSTTTLKADAEGFLIADSATDINELVVAMEGVREDTSEILALMKSSARENLLRMQKVATPASQAAAARRATTHAANAPTRSTITVNPLVLVASPPPARERDHLGRFASSMPPPANGMSAAPVLRLPSAPLGVRDSRAPTPVAAPVAHAAPVRHDPPATPAPAPARARDERGRFIAGPPPDLSPVARAVESLTRQQLDLAKADKRAESSRANLAGNEDGAPRMRDARGRFGSGGADGGARADAGLLSRLKSLIPQFAGGSSDLEKVDPTVEAAQEVGQMMATPFKAVGAVAKMASRGFLLRADKDPAVPWYRRIWQELRLSRRQDSEFNLAQTRTLKEIERKTGMSGGEKPGVLGSLGGMLGGRGLLGGAAALGKGLLKRVPLLGGLFAGGSALASMFGGDDPMKTAAENRKDRFTGSGSGIGSLVGGGVGMLVGGPLGAVVGGVVGDKVGELMGGWLSEVDWADVGARMTATWDTSVQWFRDKWAAATGKWDEFVGGAGKAWDGLVAGAKAFLKDKFGIDVDAITAKVQAVAAPVVDAVKKTAAPVVDTAKAGYEAAKDSTKAAVDYGKERVEKMAAPIARAADNALDYGKGLFGKGSKGNRAALVQGMVNAGIIDPKEQAMFMAQMDHESGGFRSLEESVKYKPKAFLARYGKRAGITTEDQAKAILDKGETATAEAMYGGAWGTNNLGNTEAGDGARFKGRGFTQLTGRANYTAAAKATGLDLVNNPELAADPANAAKIATWYWQSRKGLSDAGKAGDVIGATKKINGGTNGLNDRAEKYEKYLALTTKSDFAPATMAAGKIPGAAPAIPGAAGANGQPGATGAPAGAPAALDAPGVAAGATGRAAAFAAAAPASFQAPAPAVMPRVTASSAPTAPPRMSTPSVAVPAAASVPPVAQAAIPVPLSSKAPMEVTIANEQAVGQDLRDRKLAMIATGGLAA